MNGVPGRVLFLSTADTDLLALRTVVESLPADFPEVAAANPVALAPAGLPDALTAEPLGLVVVRLLGGRRAWERGFDSLVRACAAGRVALAAFGGEAVPDLELAAASTLPPDVMARAFEYLAQGGPENVANALRYLVDQATGTAFGAAPPRAVPEVGVLERRRTGSPPTDRPPNDRSATASSATASSATDRPPNGGPATAPPPTDRPATVRSATARSATARPAAQGAVGRPKVGIVFYRAHVVVGNTGFVEALCDEVEAAGGEPVALWCYSLRPSTPGAAVAAVEALAASGVDAVVTTVWASGSAGADGEGWDASELAGLGVPVIQAVASTSSREAWERSAAGLAPFDVATGVAIPEFDGRIDGPAFSFKEVVDDGEEIGTPVTAYRVAPDRTRRAARLAVRHGRLASTPRQELRVAIVLSAYPTKRSRLGNAVGLDTPASVLALLHALSDRGVRVDRVPSSGDELMAELADGLTYDVTSPTPAQCRTALALVPAEQYREWFGRVAAGAREAMVRQWGEAPGTVGLDGDRFVLAGMDLGGVVVAIQPPRGYGADPIALYHSPDLPPTHQYMAFYRWLDEGWGADAVVHVGKHGTLEWLPGKGTGLSGSCFPDAVLGDLPLVYPFVVNDPGEGTQAKRRAHAVVVDHLVPPLTRADSYGGIARLESLLDAHAQVASMDPSKLPSLRAQVWQAVVDEQIHRDLGIGEQPDLEGDQFDEVVLGVDGYLCELKDAQIRGGLHVLGEAPAGTHLVDMVLAITRLPQGGHASLRQEVAAEMGLVHLRTELGRGQATDPDSGLGADVECGTEGGSRRGPAEPNVRQAVDAVEARCRALVEQVAAAGWCYDGPSPVLHWICDRLVPALQATTGEIDMVLAALEGRHVPAGPSGAPTRSGAHVLPTGRNFYSIDPKGVPSRLAWDVGVALADGLCRSYLEAEGRWPVSVALVAWGTSAMRTGGDDVAEVLALMGVRPLWNPDNGRVTGLDVMSLEELGRPRVDVTLRISGFFRDAFPEAVRLVDQAASLVAQMKEPEDRNPLVGTGSTPRIFGPKPGAYGSGVLGVIEAGDWKARDDLAAVWLEWSGWSYGAAAMGRPDAEALAVRLAKVEVAAKNQDNREHDIFDSDDYLQDHGGMVAAVAALAGRAPLALFGDSSDPASPRTRTLEQEAARVVRSRVLNPKWIGAMLRHGYKGAFEMAATVDYLFGYDSTAGVAQDWMYERITDAYVADPEVRRFFQRSSPWALQAIAERLLEAAGRGMWDASEQSLQVLRRAVLEAEGWEESR